MLPACLCKAARATSHLKMQLLICSELACPLLRHLAVGVAGAAAAMAAPGRQLPAALCDESQDAVAALYILLQVRASLVLQS